MSSHSRVVFLITAIILVTGACRLFSQSTVQAPPSPDNRPTPSVQVDSVPADGHAQALLPESRRDLHELPNLTRYSMDVALDVAAHTFKVQANLVYTNTETVALNEIYFRLLPNGGKSYGNGALEVRQITINGTLIDIIQESDASILALRLQEVLEPGDSIRVGFEFDGRVPVDFGGSGYGIYNYSQGVMALSGWYPLLAVYDQDGWNLDPVSAIGDSVYSDTALYDVRITAPSDQVLAATGIEVNRVEQGQQNTYHYLSGPVRDFFMILGADYKRVEQHYDGIQINSYYLPGDEETGRAALEISGRSLEIYNQSFGSYPFTELDVVAAPMQAALGVEYPGVILISSELYAAEPTDPSFVVTTAHEVAHQWWYSLVGNDVFEHPWMDEALTTYSSGLYYQEAVADEAYRGLHSYWEQRVEGLTEEEQAYPVNESLAYFEALPNWGAYGGIVYSKGALFFAALRDEIGDEAFFRGLQNYYSAHRYGIAEPKDLLTAFTDAADRPLERFYQEWLSGY